MAVVTSSHLVTTSHLVMTGCINHIVVVAVVGTAGRKTRRGHVGCHRLTTRSKLVNLGHKVPPFSSTVPEAPVVTVGSAAVNIVFMYLMVACHSHTLARMQNSCRDPVRVTSTPRCLIAH